MKIDVEISEGEVKAITGLIRVRLMEPTNRVKATQAIIDALAPILGPILARAAGPSLTANPFAQYQEAGFSIESVADGLPVPGSVAFDAERAVVQNLEQLQLVLGSVAPAMIEEAMAAGRGFCFLMRVSNPTALDGVRERLAAFNSALQPRGYQLGIDPTGPLPTVFAEWAPDPESPPGSAYKPEGPAGEA